MIHLSHRRRRPAGGLLRRSWLPLAPVLIAGLSLVAPALAGGATTAPSHADAVRISRVAAKAVLERAGAETCLRGKLTRALLGLSASCEAAGERSPLCSLADKAVVVTPMSLSFMDETAHQLLDLTSDAIGASAQRP